MYKILETFDFEKEFNKLPKNIKDRFLLKLKKVKKDPFHVGDPLKGRKWFRELKEEGYRTYLLIYKEIVLVLLVAVSNKKTQQEVIDLIVNNFAEYKNLINKITFKKT